jgi:hypothetical protein
MRVSIIARLNALRFCGVFKVKMTTPASSSRRSSSAVAADEAEEVDIGVLAVRKREV